MMHVAENKTHNTDLTDAFQKTFARTDALFDLITPEAYFARPIPLRHPINFYEGHLAAFIWNTLFKRVLQQGTFNEHFDSLFERGIDPGNTRDAQAASIHHWPARSNVKAYQKQVRERLFDFLQSNPLEESAHPAIKNRSILFMLLEHELMHQETLLYILHQLPTHQKRKPQGVIAVPEVISVSDSHSPQPEMRDIPAGNAVLGASPEAFDFSGDFVWDNERPAHTVFVEAFAMDVYNVTNGQFLDFINTDGYNRPEFWRAETWAWLQQESRRHPPFWIKKDGQWALKDFFEERPLPLSWPVYVTHAEAEAYARFVGKALPTEAEWHRAAFGDSDTLSKSSISSASVISESSVSAHSLESIQKNPIAYSAGLRAYPWGNAPPTIEHGNFNFHYWSPTPVGHHPKGRSPFGIEDLLGNGWEWTSTVFAPFSGFEASPYYPQYSADFFDGQHYVLKGACPFTDARLLRRSFRNWFYWHYPYMYAGFRCVQRA